MSVVIDAGTCIGCSNCIGECPVSALTMVDGKAVVDENTCIDCGNCIPACPVEAITL